VIQVPDNTAGLAAQVVRLCAQVASSSNRAELRKVLDDLNAAHPSRPTSGQLAYAARRQQAQFLGYLLVDENRSEMSGVTIEPLGSSERRIIVRGHAAILRINAACLESLSGLRPELAGLIDPYARLRSLRATVPPAPTLMDEAAVLAVSGAFASSAASARVLQVPEGIRSQVAPDVLAGLIERLWTDLESAGPADAPEEILQLIRRPPEPVKELLTLAFSVLCLREMLRNVDQAIFQAVTRDERPSIDDRILYHLVGPASHVVGSGFIVDCAGTPQLIHIHPAELITLQSATAGVTETCFVSGLELSMGPESGFRLHLRLRMLDGDLNHFFGLLSQPL
jgi:hypothetical protein